MRHPIARRHRVISGDGVASSPLPRVIAIFLSNLPEGLSATAGTRKAGRSSAYEFGSHAAIAVAFGLVAVFLPIKAGHGRPPLEGAHHEQIHIVPQRRRPFRRDVGGAQQALH
jgi:hypothetical protein